MERLRPEEDPGRSALTSTSGKYACKSVEWRYILSRKYFLVFKSTYMKAVRILSKFVQKLDKIANFTIRNENYENSTEK